ncbi:hypothetical protein [Thermocrispum municipale]|uniref:hypothetical protein n=1 Tax=Thermocrispum municipale TaxID=37926 RepID=UPI00041C9352|nr:hypothetical protein [Thermocrispum municipale]
MSSVEELRANRPAQAAQARICAVIAAVLWVPVIGGLVVPETPDSYAGLPAIAAVLHAWGSFGVVKGRQSGRVVCVVTAVVLWVMVLPYSWIGMSSDDTYASVYAVLDLVAVALSVAGIALQFSRPVTEYVNAVSHAMRAQDETR